MNKLKFLGSIVFLTVCTGLCTYNLFYNNEFFETSFTTIISIIIAVMVSYFLTQKKTDDRRKSEKIDKLLYKIQEIICDEKFTVVKEQDLIIHRSVANKIVYLKDNITDEGMKGLINRMEEIFEEYRDFYSNHYKDTEYMEKSTKELANYVSRMDDLCDEIHMKLM